MVGAAQVGADIRRIALFRALYLGDLLCATPALWALRRRFPRAEITLIGLPWAAELIGRLPTLDRFVPFPGWPGIVEAPYDATRTARFLVEARATGCDLAIQLHGDGSSSNGFVAALGARQSLGYRRDSADDRLSLSLPYDQDEHETRRWLRLVAVLGATTTDTCLEFPIRPAERARADELLAAIPAGPGTGRGAPRIGVHPGAKDPARRWPADCFAALADRLVERHGARIVLTGAASERALTGAVHRAMRWPALDLAGMTDLGTFAATIAGLDLLVTNDTGASHLAAATGTRSVVLFGPTRPARWAPLDRARHQVVDALTLVDGPAEPATVLRHLPLEPVLAACDTALDIAMEATCDD